MLNTPQPPRLQPKRSTARAIAFRRPSSSVQVGYYWLITITRHGGDHAAPNGSKQHQAGNFSPCRQRTIEVGGLRPTAVRDDRSASRRFGASATLGSAAIGKGII